MSTERPARSRRTVLAAGALTGLGLAGAQLAGPGPAGAATADGTSSAGDTPSGGETAYLVGRGVADATGEVAEVGMMGYGRFDQQAAGLHTRLRARGFVVVDRATGRRVMLIVADSPMIFESVHQEVLRRLAARYGDLYTEQNVLITATHTHAGPGGYSHHLLYNATTFGFHRKTFEAVADGLLEAARRAHDDLAPSDLVLSHGTLTGASANRSRVAFDRNPKADRDHFPDAVDPHTALLRVERAGRAVGAINWFPVHGTSMSGDNRLISADNKGFAAYHWEREVNGVDYLADGSPAFVSAFAQTNSGDMSPNLDLEPRPHRRTSPTPTPAGSGSTRPPRRSCTSRASDCPVRWTPGSSTSTSPTSRCAPSSPATGGPIGPRSPASAPPWPPGAWRTGRPSPDSRRARTPSGTRCPTPSSTPSRRS